MFACKNDANRDLDELIKKFSLLEVIDRIIIKHKRYKQRGKPKKDQEPDFYEYSIEATYAFKIESYYQEIWKKYNRIF